MPDIEDTSAAVSVAIYATTPLADENIGKDDVSDESPSLKQQYLKSLKRILGFHLIAAEQAGVASEVEEVKKLMAGLP